jgi:hypothetical protein
MNYDFAFLLAHVLCYARRVSRDCHSTSTSVTAPTTVTLRARNSELQGALGCVYRVR